MQEVIDIKRRIVVGEGGRCGSGVLSRTYFDAFQYAGSHFPVHYISPRVLTTASSRGFCMRPQPRCEKVLVCMNFGRDHARLLTSTVFQTLAQVTPCQSMTVRNEDLEISRGPCPKRSTIPNCKPQMLNIQRTVIGLKMSASASNFYIPTATNTVSGDDCILRGVTGKDLSSSIEQMSFRVEGHNCQKG